MHDAMHHFLPRAQIHHAVEPRGSRSFLFCFGAENPFKRRRLLPLRAKSSQDMGAAPTSASLQADLVPGSCLTHKPHMSVGATALCLPSGT